MKIAIFISVLVLFGLSACSYLPADQLEIKEKIRYEETSEYIKLSSPGQSSTEALLFIPGGLVDPHAYISLMEKNAEEGLTVFILKVAANLAILENGKAFQIMREMPEIRSWYIGGHSLGGISALAAINKDRDVFAGLILLGVYSSEGFSIRDWDKNVLSLYAENDQLSSVEQIEANKAFLPEERVIDELADLGGIQVNGSVCLYFLIRGGNHAQFGDYGPQEGDGLPAISVEEQHRQVSEGIRNFIIWNESL